MLRHSFLLIFLSFLSFDLPAQIIDLSGEWSFAIDRRDEGETGAWHTKDFEESVRLPGSMAENGKGDDVSLETQWTGGIYDSSFYFHPRLEKYRKPGNIKFPFWLTPSKYYVGAAWYRKSLEIPANWKGKTIRLFLERVHTESLLYINGAKVGLQNSMVAPHQYDITSYLHPGKNTFHIRVDNRIKSINVGPDSHSLTDHTQGNWNGIVGRMELQADDPVYMDEVQIYPDIRKKEAVLKFWILNNSGKRVGKGVLEISAESVNSEKAHSVSARKFTVDGNVSSDTFYHSITVPFGDGMLLWDEYDPALYTIRIRSRFGSYLDTVEIRTGMRDFSIEGTRFTVNGKPVFLRGTLHCGEAPLTGYPDMEKAHWIRLFQKAKDFGMNHIRFHSWCPPEAAFSAADQLGLYLQPEGPSWPNHGTSLGDGKPVDDFILAETQRMEARYGNHASYCMLAAGNEPAGKQQARYLADFVQFWKEKDSRRVYTGASVAMSWPLVPENEYMVKSGPRNLHWDKNEPETESDFRKALEGFTVPYITHEMGQYCAFPDFKEINLYTGVYKARNFELFREDLSDHGMADQAEDFLMASGKLQLLSYKNEIEKSLRTPGLAGYQLLGLQDFPGQGTALVGVLNAFWKEKGYASAEEYSRFNSALVPLARMPSFVYTNHQTFRAQVELFQFTADVLKHAEIAWEVSIGGKLYTSGKFPASDYGRGNCVPVGEISFPLNGITKAAQCALRVSVSDSGICNEWNFWVYPGKEEQKEAGNILVTDTLDAKAMAVLNEGGKVLLDAGKNIVKGREVVMHFTPVFWNTSWFKMRPPHVTGLLIRNEHPVFKDFPTEMHSDLQWWELVNKAPVMHLEDFPAAFRPLVQPIDTWFLNRKLAVLMEMKVGRGKLMVCSLDIFSDAARRPAAAQLKKSILGYMESGAFDPLDNVDISLIHDIFQSPSRLQWDAFTNDAPDELKPIK